MTDETGEERDVCILILYSATAAKLQIKICALALVVRILRLEGRRQVILCQ